MESKFKVKNRYLFEQCTYSRGSNSIVEFEFIEISETAYKVKYLLQDNYIEWINKTLFDRNSNFDRDGYFLLENLGPIRPIL